MSVPNGATEDAPRAPARALLKRIDIGLTTGIVAVFVSFLAVIVANNQAELAQHTAKASVLPVIRIDMFHEISTPPYRFETRIQNDGVGIARIETAKYLTSEGGEEIGYEDLIQIVANPQAFADDDIDSEISWSVGFLPAGESISPIIIDFGNDDADLSNIRNFLRQAGDANTRKLDLEICYCSVFDDCWIARRMSLAAPRPVDNCGIDGDFIDGLLQ